MGRNDVCVIPGCLNARRKPERLAIFNISILIFVIFLAFLSHPFPFECVGSVGL